MDAVTSAPSAMTHHVIGGTTAAGSGAGIAGMGIGGLALGGLGGLILGSLINGNNGLLGGNNNSGAGAAVALGGIEFMEQMGDIKTAIALAPQAAVQATLATSATTQTALATNNLTTLQSVNQLQSNLQASATQQLITSLQSFNSLQAATSAGFNSAATATSESASDIKLQLAGMTAQAAAVAAAQALAMQECCCELRTQALENTQKILDQNTNFRIQDLQIENSNLRQTQVLRDQADAQTRTILSHLIPASPVVARTI